MQIESSTGNEADNSIIVWVDDEAVYGLDGHTIGRDQNESITVDHAQVSRRHAVLEHGPGGWAIRDLGSTNGLHDGQGRHDHVVLPPGRNQVWLGPPETSPCLYFDVPVPSAASFTQAFSFDDAPSFPDPGPAVDPAPNPAPNAPAPPAPNPGPAAAPAPAPAPPAPNQPAPSPPPGLGGPAGDAGGPAPSRPGQPPAPHTQALYTPPQHLGDQPRSAAELQPAQPPAPVLNDAGLQDNVGQHSQIIQVQSTGELILGRASDCDISIPDPLVSRKHARLILQGTSGRIIDLNSDNGTFVNGQRVSDITVTEGDLIEMGKAQFILSGGQLRQHVAHGLPLQADSLTVTVGGGLILLSEVSFTLPAGSMTAVVGPSGSGKSTLLNALTGRRPADEGRVILGGRDLYASDEGLARRIGFVPQDDPVHEALSVRHALTAAARLRLPADASKNEIKANVERVAAELGLSDRLDTRVRALSGGQRKRVSVGYELVGEPQALILDEPTSGLDPGLERELMTNLRELADKGTTTVVVTHSVQSVELCDLVLVLAPGGRLAFIGPPNRVARHFNCPDLASVFTLLGSRPRAEWEMEFAQTTSYLKFGAPVPAAAAAPAEALPKRSFVHDLGVMTGRYLRSLAGDRRRLLLLLLQAPLLGILLSLVLFTDAFAFGPGSGAGQYLMATVLAMTWLGGSNSVREIVQDRAVFQREKAVGVSTFGFVLSRWVVLSLATTVQAVILHLIASIRQKDSLGSGALFASGHLELMLALAGVGVAAVGVGLLISAMVSDTAKALTILPLVLIPILLLSGLVVTTWGRPGIQELTYLNPVQWGGSMGAVTLDLQGGSGCDVLTEVSQEDLDRVGLSRDACTNERWVRDVPTQTLNLIVLGAWTVILLPVAGMATSWTLGRPLRRD